MLATLGDQNNVPLPPGVTRPSHSTDSVLTVTFTCTMLWVRGEDSAIISSPLRLALHVGARFRVWRRGVQPETRVGSVEVQKEALPVL